MSVKQFTVDFQNIGQQEFLRLNVDYRYFFDIQKAKVFKSKNNIKLKHVLNEIEIKKVPKGELDDSEILIDLCNIERRFNNLINLEEVNEIGSDKNILQSGNIVIPKMQPQMGNIFLNLEHKRYIGSTELLEYLISDNHNPLFIYYLFTTNKFLSDLGKLESGKTHRRVNSTDLLKIKIPLIPKPTQDQIVTQIGPIEQKIKDLKKTIKEPQKIINKVFAREFGFDENLYNEFGKGMTAGTQIAENRTLRFFETEFKKFSRSRILRFSTRYHNTPTKKLMNLLDCMDTLQVKDVIAEPIHRGASPKYNSKGEIPVVKTGHLKNGYVEISQEEFVDQDFYKLSERSQIKENDILIASTGKVSLGKIDLLEDNQSLVADGHISIIRVNKNTYNRLFFTYFFRSILGYFQIERDYTGATNQIELYSKEITNFQIPDIPLEKQQKIVDEIKAKLDKQEEIDNQIRQERNKIEEIIKKAIT